MKSAAQAEDGTDVLVGICHAFGSTSDPGEVVVATMYWVRQALGDAPATISLVLPDQAGRLRLAATQGRLLPEGRPRSTRRRRVFQSKSPSRMALRDGAGRVLHIFPLVSRGESVGVVEVIAPGTALDERIEILEAVLAQAAAVLRNMRERERSERALRGLGAVVGLAADMLRGGSPVRSVRAAAGLCHEHLLLPVVGWLPDAVGGQSVVVTRGFGPARRAEVRRVLEQLASVPSAQVADVVAEALESVVGTRPVVVRAGEAFLAVMGTPNEAGTVLLGTVASLLGDTLQTIGAVTEAKARTDGLDVGIAWTAHELRGPLLNARTAIDHLISVNGRGEQRNLLRHTRDELVQLAELVDPMLRWSAGGELHKRRADLVKIVREAVESCALEYGEHRVVLSAPRSLGLRADPKQLRSAVANLLRNALMYSPDQDEVAVEVGRTDGTAWIYVRDRGPGVPPEEGQMIFDLFARGSAGAHAREGAGVGLFITRRVVEAHGGSVRLVPSERGAAFSIELPIATERSAASAS